jgi:hypothetical protein
MSNVCVNGRLLALLFAAASAFLASALLPASASDRGGVIPEVYAPEGMPVCLFRAQVTGEPEVRRKRVLGFLRRAYADEDQWKQLYLFFDVDHSEFASFGFVAFLECESSTPLVERLAALFADCTVGTDAPCDAGMVTFARQPGSPFLTRRPILEPPVVWFERIRGTENLSGCTLKMLMKSEKFWDDEIVSSIRRSLWLLRTKYLMPLMDVHNVDGHFYILLSRRCEKKERLFEQMKTLLETEGFTWDDHLWEPDFAPDVSEYRFIEAGAYRLKPPPGRSTW